MDRKYEIGSICNELNVIRSKLSLTLDANEKNIFTSLVAGGILAGECQLPSSPVDIPKNYFMLNHEQFVGNILAEINERTMIDMNMAMDIARNLFMFRYRLVFESNFLLHNIFHMAGCSDDAVNTKVRAVLLKVKEAGGLENENDGINQYVRGISNYARTIVNH